MTRHTLVRLADLDRLKGLNERYRQLSSRLEALAEDAAYYDRPALGLQVLQEEAMRVRRKAAQLLRRMADELDNASRQ